MKIAQVAPLYESVPPYGGTEGSVIFDRRISWDGARSYSVRLHPVRFTPLVAAGAWAFVFPPGEADCHDEEAEVATRVWVCFRAGVCSPGEAQA